jgi:CheY-like chemotaxis protein
LHAQRQGSEVLLVVRDSGIGIPGEMQTCIFDLFTQIDRPLEKRYTGLGIGLTLVKSLVDMHGGRVEVYSEGSNRGSEFRVHLPVAVDMPVAMPAPVQTGGEATTQFRRKVLIVDDNQEAAITLSIVVRMFGSEVRTAGDGQEGIQAAAEFLPDVILMDLRMPGMNGYEAVRHIRRQSWGEQMLIVALTGWGQDEDRQRTREAGFDHHLVKPVESSELQKVLETVATSAGAARGICQTTCRLAGS